MHLPFTLFHTIFPQSPTPFPTILLLYLLSFTNSHVNFSKNLFSNHSNSKGKSQAMNIETYTQEKPSNDHGHGHDHDEVLSLSDLPLIQNDSSDEEIEELPLPPQHEFNFHYSPSKNSEIRTADQIFFQGQIMPTKTLKSDYPRSESINSHHSSTSTGSSSSSAAPRNLFHSHPSPSPRILSNERKLFLKNSYIKKSWSRSFFRLGLIAPPPEIPFHELKTRCYGKSTAVNGGGEKKPRVKTWDLAGGCKNCSVDVKYMKRSASDGERRRRKDGEENLTAAININKSASYRTFEWLKQLSIHGADVDER